MKAHIGLDAGTGIVHTVVATAANAHDITQTSKLIRADDHVVYGDSGYTGIEAREEIVNDVNLAGKEYRICKKPGKMKGVKRNGLLCNVLW